MVLVVAALALVIGCGVALAASLGVTSADLTTYSVATTVPLSTCTVTSAADTYASQATLSAGSNFGGASSMQVESSQTLVTLLPTNKRSFVRFDLSSCSIPSVAQVTGATLKLYLATAPSASRTYQVFRTAASWGESTLTWNNQPSVAGSATASASTGTSSDVTLSFDVTADVRAFVAGSDTNTGWRLNDGSETSATTRSGTFGTREAANPAQRPTLVVTYYP